MSDYPIHCIVVITADESHSEAMCMFRRKVYSAMIKYNRWNCFVEKDILEKEGNYEVNVQLKRNKLRADEIPYFEKYHIDITNTISTYSFDYKK